MTAVDEPVQVTAEAERTRHSIFKYSEWVHVGEGVEECPLVIALRDKPGAGKTEDLPLCQNPDHFHAWCRLPNPYQVRDITEKAQAAGARTVRQLRDPESDQYAILESELDALKDDNLRPILAEEILDKEFAEHYMEAVSRVLEVDDPDWVPNGDEPGEPPKLYAHIESEQEEYARQTQLPEDQRDESYSELSKYVAEYSRVVDVELESIRKPLRENLLTRDMSELVEIARRDRIQRRGDEAHLHTWNTWQWYVCTFKPRKRGTPNERYFSDIATFKYETPPDVIQAIQLTFSVLENEMTRGRTQGNS